MKIGMQRVNVDSEDIIKNSCPICGYLTLDERSSFDIYSICFWEDDGIDDIEENNDSGPNHMTLKEGREIFQKTKRKLLTSDLGDDKLIGTLKNKFTSLDNSIDERKLDKTEIIRLQHEIIDLLSENKIYGLKKLFDK
jgi:hypothetical protein